MENSVVIAPALVDPFGRTVDYLRHTVSAAKIAAISH